jgi:hypothetical protein
MLIVNTPKSQGFSGFPSEPVKLTDIEFDYKTKFATIIISSLDNLPLSSSKKMLLSAVGRCENPKDIREYKIASKSPNGMDRGEAVTITKVSEMMVKNKVEDKLLTEAIYADITLNGNNIKLTPLDEGMGKLQDAVIVNGSGEKTTFKIGDYKTVWFLLERE